MTKAPPNSEARIAFSEIRDVQSQLSKLDAPGMIDWALERFGERLAFASSFGPEDIVLIDLASKTGRPYRVFTLDTARLHTETYETWQRIESRYDLHIETLFPEASSVAELVKKQGPNGFYDSVDNRRACCEVRKVVPLRAQLKNLDAWVTGMRKEQSANRANVQHVEIDLANGGLAKFNPLVDWSESDVWNHIKEHNLPYNPLHDDGFPSIGCAPCTRAVKPGDDPRSGRWWWESKDENECGIHQHVKTQ